MRKRVLLPLALAVWLPTAQAAMPTLGDLYKALRPALCLAMGSVQSCELPEEIVTPASWSEVETRIRESSRVYIVGIPPNAGAIKSILARRMSQGPSGKLAWIVLRENSEALNEWFDALKDRVGDKAVADVELVRVEEVDTVGSVARIPFVFVGDKVFFYAAGRLWLEPVRNGGIAETLVSVLGTGVRYLAEHREMRERVDAEEAGQ